MVWNWTEKNRLVSIGKDFQQLSCSTQWPLQSWTKAQMLLRALSRCFWNTARLGTPTFSPGRLFQGYTTCCWTKVCWCQCLFFALMHLWSQIITWANQRGAPPSPFPCFWKLQKGAKMLPLSLLFPKVDKPVTPSSSPWDLPALDTSSLSGGSRVLTTLKVRPHWC